MSKIIRKIETLQASLANAASTYFLTQQAILENEYTFAQPVDAVGKGSFAFETYLGSGDGDDNFEDLDVLVSRMTSSLRWMNQVQTMLANLMSDYYRDLAIEIVRVAKASAPAAPKARRKAA